MPCFVVLSIGCLGAQLVLIVGFRALSSRRSTRLWCKSTCAQETLMPKPEHMLKRFLFQTRASRWKKDCNFFAQHGLNTLSFLHRRVCPNSLLHFLPSSFFFSQPLLSFAGHVLRKRCQEKMCSKYVKTKRLERDVQKTRCQEKELAEDEMIWRKPSQHRGVLAQLRGRILSFAFKNLASGNATLTRLPLVAKQLHRKKNEHDGGHAQR